MDEMTRIEAEFDEEVNEKMPNRANEWEEFSDVMWDHVVEYTVPQYGDYPNDQLTAFSIEEVAAQLKRYVNRIGSNSRGHGEALRDCLKMAHYACILRSKLIQEIEEEMEKVKDNNDSSVEVSIEHQLKELWVAIVQIRKSLEKLTIYGKLD